MTKLYEVPRGTWVQPVEDVNVPIAALEVERGAEIFFYHLDGMYSYCKNKEGQVVHLPAWQEVHIMEKQLNDPRT